MATSQPHNRPILIPWGFREVSFGFVGLIALSVSVNFILVLLTIDLAVKSDGIDSIELVPDEISASSILLATLAFQVGILLIAVYLGPRRFRYPLSCLGLTIPRLSAVVRWSLLGVGLSIASTAIYNAIMTKLAPSLVPPTIPSGLRIDETALLAFIVVVITGPVAEEIFFRGFLFPGVAKKWGVPLGIGGSSALFALSHGSIAAMIPIFVTGLIFCWIYYRTNSICPTIIAHILQNALAYSAVMWI